MNNRIIKYRVYCKTTKHFSVQPALLASGNQLLWLHTRNVVSISNLDEEEYIIQQFTGLLDLNQKEIYEGDIVEQEFTVDADPNSMIENWYWSKYKYQVVWDNNQHRFGFKQLNWKYAGEPVLENLPHGLQSNHIRIVGNIYEK